MDCGELDNDVLEILELILRDTWPGALIISGGGGWRCRLVEERDGCRLGVLSGHGEGGRLV